MLSAVQDISFPILRWDAHRHATGNPLVDMSIYHGMWYFFQDRTRRCQSGLTPGKNSPLQQILYSRYSPFAFSQLC